MQTWFDYRRVWSAHPWVLAYFALVVAVIVLAVFGTIDRGPLAILFIPGLAGAYAHHAMVGKRLS